METNRMDFSFLPDHDSSSEDLSPSLEGPEDVTDSRVPLNLEEGNRNVHNHDKNSKFKNRFRNNLSFALSVFNLMNAILGSGILGLGEAMKNLGIVPFLILIFLTASLAFYTINMLLHLSEITNIKTYEGLAQRSFGVKGKVFTTVMIILHCLGAICSYVYIIKTELPEIVKVFVTYTPKEGVPEPFYLNGNFLMLSIVVVIITPLATMKDIKLLGYSSAFGMACMLTFTFMVVIKKFSIPCPLEISNITEFESNETLHNIFEVEEEQYCEPKFVNINTRTAYAVPTMIFSFMCHASMLPIYAELRKPSLGRMQKVAGVSIGNVLLLYVLSALFGYLTFFNRVRSELLLTYSLYNPDDVVIIISRIMVIICVTLSVPLLHYPARKSIILTLFPKQQEFSWLRHIVVMIFVLALSVVLVLFIPNIRDIFGMAGATTSASLLVVLPSAFFIRLTGPDCPKNDIIRKYRRRRLFAMFLCMFGCIFMLLSITLIIIDWVS